MSISAIEFLQQNMNGLVMFLGFSTVPVPFAYCASMMVLEAAEADQN